MARRSMPFRRKAGNVQGAGGDRWSGQDPTFDEMMWPTLQALKDMLASVIRAHLYMEATLNLLIEECLAEPAAISIGSISKMKVGLVMSEPLSAMNEGDQN